MVRFEFSPIIFGFVHDLTGSYRSSLLTFGIALILSALLSLAVRAPRKMVLAMS